MSTYVISDLHLEESRPHITSLFVEFLHGLPSESRLLILGDLFEAWIGDDDDRELAATVSDALASVAARGMRTSFISGNRDFLVGRSYAARSGFDLLEDGSVLDIEGTPTLVMHGDTLCTGDVRYQAFRQQVRSAAWQEAFLSKSLEERRAFAATARAESTKHTQAAEAAIMDVAGDEVSRVMGAAGVTRLIHGHTHRPAVHALEIGGRYAERVVLGDWYRWGSVLRIDRQQLELAPLGV